MFRIVSLVFFVAAASSASAISPRILGGHDADIADFPYIASIELVNFGHYCGAVIIDAQWALTDAWCRSVPVFVEDYSLRVGSALVGNGTQHAVVQWIHHPLNDVFNGLYDFALVQVDPPFEFGENVATVPLAAQDELTPDGAEALIAGWGKIVPSEDATTDHLQFGVLSVFNDTACSDLLDFQYSESKLCAQDPNAAVAHCYRDEGGPLVVDGTLFGVALYPGSCGDPLVVQLYARVASVRDWIDSTIAA